MPESRGWVAIWMPSGLITKEQMAEIGKDAIEAAHEQGATSVTFPLPDGQLITMMRLVVRLPVFIESPDWRESRDFADALQERADRSLAN